MSTQQKFIASLDIGTTKVCAIVATEDEYGDPIILGNAVAISKGVTRGDLVNIEDTVQSIKTVIEDVSRQSNVDIETVYVGIAGEHVRSKSAHEVITFQQKTITKQDTERLNQNVYTNTVVDLGTDIVHAFPQQYKVDEHSDVTNPVGMTGVRLECDYHVVSARTTSIKNIKTCLQQCNLEMAELILQPYASTFSVLTDEEKEAGVCLIDIGGGTTDIAIYHNNILRHTAVIPFGGNVITGDIAIGCNLMLKHAEKLKLDYGTAMPTEEMERVVLTLPTLQNRRLREIKQYTLACIINSRLEEIFNFVLREIYKTDYAKKLVAGVVITGGGSLMKDIDNLAMMCLGLDTRIGSPSINVKKGKAKEIEHPMYATSVGLALYGLKQPSNVTPEKQAPSIDEPKENKEGAKKGFFNKMINTVSDTIENLMTKIESSSNSKID